MFYCKTNSPVVREWKKLLTILFILLVPLKNICAQDNRAEIVNSIVKGKVLDTSGTPMMGATIIIKKGGIATTNKDGFFSITYKGTKATLLVSYVGYDSKEVPVNGSQSGLEIRLTPISNAMDSVVVIGYGQQKRIDVLGSVTQTTTKDLQRAGGVNDLGMALTGNLPGLTTMTSTGEPGEETPQLVIRSATSWNNSAPLVLVDGVERSISTVDIASVKTVTVLKDATATAVYGVRGANGVILITTKQGSLGKASIEVRSNMTAKVASKLPKKYDAYDTWELKDMTIERELPLTTAGWTTYLDQAIINLYRNPANDSERDQYPNVDWEKALFKNHTMSYNTSVNVTGGSKFVTYFAGIDFDQEGDLFRTYQNGRGYKAGYGYTRTNVRSNLDFNITKTTKLSTKLFGSNGIQKVPWGTSDGDATYWSSAYLTAPDAMQPIYSDGTWGFYSPRNADVPNSVYFLAMSGVEKRTNTQLTTDFILDQKLDMIAKGLDFNARYSLDNTFQETGYGIDDQYNNAQRKWVDPQTGLVYYEQTINTGTQLDFSNGINWTTQGGDAQPGSTYRMTNYAFQLNYANSFGNHNVTAMGLLKREKSATGSNLYTFREDWVFRATYNYNEKYFFEGNGAYNGSQQFSPAYRLAFFPSVAAGWVISNEKIVKKLGFINLLKLRASWGKVGDDALNGVPTYPYIDQWSYGGNTMMGTYPANTPYTYYDLTTLGNPNLHWETSQQQNYGIDYGFLDNQIAGSLDMFRNHRTDIIIAGGNRAIPSYFGATAPSANLGETRSHGFEFELKLNHTFKNAMHVYANFGVTHAVNKVIFEDDPELLPAYEKLAGYPIGQTKSYLSDGFLKSWDDVYGSTARTSDNTSKLPGDYNIIDFNGDGTIDTYDQAPYQYTGTPQNTYNMLIGFDWKGFSIYAQFYGVNNVTRQVSFPTFRATSDVAYAQGTYWTKQGGGSIPYPRWSTIVGPDASGTMYLYDGSYVRLKNAGISYTMSGIAIRRMGIKSLQVYLNGDNLILWTKMPDDRESNFSGSSGSGAYPTLRRFNLGLQVNL